MIEDEVYEEGFLMGKKEVRKCFKCSNEAKVCHQCVAKELDEARVDFDAQLKKNVMLEFALNDEKKKLGEIEETCYKNGFEKGRTYEREIWSNGKPTFKKMLEVQEKKARWEGFLECLKEIEKSALKTAGGFAVIVALGIVAGWITSSWSTIMAFLRGLGKS